MKRYSTPEGASQVTAPSEFFTDEEIAKRGIEPTGMGRKIDRNIAWDSRFVGCYWGGYRAPAASEIEESNANARAVYWYDWAEDSVKTYDRFSKKWVELPPSSDVPKFAFDSRMMLVGRVSSPPRAKLSLADALAGDDDI